MARITPNPNMEQTNSPQTAIFLVSNTSVLAEHLKAQKLVRKLEGHRSKGKQMVMDHLIPYPAAVESDGGDVSVRLLDFDGVIGRGADAGLAMRGAQDALLRKLMTLIRESAPIPSPDQYLDAVNESNLVMVDPMCLEAA